MTIAYDAPGHVIDRIDTDAVLRISDEDDVLEPVNLHGNVAMTKVPESITAHAVLGEPGQEDAPLFLAVKAPGASQTKIVAEAEMLIGNAICADPRDEKEATCVRATLTNLPDTIGVAFDPADTEGDNLDVVTTGGHLNVTGAHFSKVTPKVDGEDREVMVVDGTGPGAEIIDIPEQLHGKIVSPFEKGDLGNLEVTADPAVGQAQLTFQNFVAPDPMPVGFPHKRIGAPEGVSQYVHVFQRGHSVKAAANIFSLKAVGLRQQRTEDGVPLDTIVASTTFGTPQSIRAYLDMQPGPGDLNEDPPALAGKRLIGDVTLSDVPADFEICFRGAEKTAETPGERGGAATRRPKARPCSSTASRPAPNSMSTRSCASRRLASARTSTLLPTSRCSTSRPSCACCCRSTRKRAGDPAGRRDGHRAVRRPRRRRTRQTSISSRPRSPASIARTRCSKAPSRTRSERGQTSRSASPSPCKTPRSTSST